MLALLDHWYPIVILFPKHAVDLLHQLLAVKALLLHHEVHAFLQFPISSSVNSLALMTMIGRSRVAGWRADAR